MAPASWAQPFQKVHSAAFTPQVIGALNSIAWWAGRDAVRVRRRAETDPSDAWRSKRETAITASLALVVGGDGDIQIILISNDNFHQNYVSHNTSHSCRYGPWQLATINGERDLGFGDFLTERGLAVISSNDFA